MGKVSWTYKQNKSLAIIENKIKFPEAVQDRVCELLNAGLYENFLSIKIDKQKKKKASLSSRVVGLMPLNVYFGGIVDKNKFLEIVQNIILIIKSCDEHLLNANNIELRPETVFIEKNLSSIKCIYWPIVNNQSYIKPRDFFKTLVQNISFSNLSSDNWLQKYNLFLNSLQPFSINDFQNLITKLQGRKIQTTDISPSSSLLNEDISSSKLHIQDSVDDISYDPLALSVSVKTQIDSKKLVASHLKLRKAKNNEQISITSAIFRIGKSKDENNYVINDNPAISRRHAEILYKSNNYFVIDRNSTNGVFLNNKKIKSGIEYKLKSGDTLRFANEEFIVE